jgi:tetratricopeptide (TPR) repeat protein
MRRSAIVVVRVLALIAAAFGIWWLCIAPYRAVRTELEVAQRSTRAVDLGDPQRTAILARENIRELEHIAAARRLEPSWYVLYAGNCELLERWQEAVDLYTRALRIDQRPELYFNRGLDRLRLGETDAAVADMATAARFNPFLLDHIDGELRARVAAAAGLH